MRRRSSIARVLILFQKHQQNTDPTSKQRGYLLPVVIALGLGIGTVSVLALQTVAQNSATLTTQSYNQLAREAAQAGLTTAISCVRAATLPTAWTNSTPLTPKKDCTINDVASQSSYLIDTTQYRSSYTVDRPTYQDTSSVTMLIKSTGKIEVKGPNGSIVSTVTQVVRAFGTNTSSGGSPVDAASISTSGSTSCVVAASWPFCWGDNSSGQLGIGKYLSNPNVSTSPLAVASNMSTQTNPGSSYTVCDAYIPFTSICVSSHTEWNPPASTAPPSELMNTNGSKKVVVKVSVGATHVCAIAKDNASDTTGETRKAYCWGDNSSGQLGNRSTTNSLVPVAVYTGAGWTTPGYCATSVPILGCTNYVDPVVNPASGLGSKVVTDISAGNGFTCAIAKNTGDTAGSTSKTYCWGDNAQGELGVNNTNSSNYPRDTIYSSDAYTIPGYCATSLPIIGCTNYVAAQNVPASAFWGKTVKSLAKVKNQTMCVTDTADTAYCWGDNSGGQVGGKQYSGSASRSASSDCEGGYPAYPGTPAAPASPLGDIPQPTAVQTSLKFSNITTWNTTTTAKTIATSPTNPNRMYWWGGAVATLTDVDQSRSNCGSTGGQSGSGVNKRISKTTATYTWTSSVPVTGPLYNSTAISGQLGLVTGNPYSGLFCTVLPPTNNIYCDGHGAVTQGQTGNGQTCGSSACSGAQAVVMTQFNTRSIDIIDSGDNHTCVTASGAVFCWGSNDKGQLGTGDPTTTNRNTPTAVTIPGGAQAGGSPGGSSGSPTNGPTTFSNPIIF